MHYRKIFFKALLSSVRKRSKENTAYISVSHVLKYDREKSWGFNNNKFLSLSWDSKRRSSVIQ